MSTTLKTASVNLTVPQIIALAELVDRTTAGASDEWDALRSALTDGVLDEAGAPLPEYDTLGHPDRAAEADAERAQYQALAIGLMNAF